MNTPKPERPLRLPKVTLNTNQELKMVTVESKPHETRVTITLVLKQPPADSEKKTEPSHE